MVICGRVWTDCARDQGVLQGRVGGRAELKTEAGSVDGWMEVF